MPDFFNMSIIEISRYLHRLLDNTPQRPYQIFANNMPALLVEYGNYTK